MVTAIGDASGRGDAKTGEDANAGEDASVKCRPLGVLDCITKANCVAASAAASCFHQRYYSVRLNSLLKEINRIIKTEIRH